MTFLDRVVEILAGLLDALGLNGTRLRWRWNQRRSLLGEQGARASVLFRSASAPHKMCPSCRALVPRSARRCTECGESLAGVAAPGLTRMMANLMPGISAATSLILLVNGVIFLLTVLAPGTSLQGEETPVGAERIMDLDSGTLLRFGAGLGAWVLQLGEWWRLVTPNFLHGGLFHILMNMYALLQLGPITEEEYGRDRFVVIYLLTGIAGFATSELLSPMRPTVGASACLSGLVGVLLVHSSRHRRTAALKQMMVQNAVLLLIVSFAFPRVDWRAHLGGLAAGALLGLVVPSGRLRSRRAERAWGAAALACVLLVLVAFWQVAAHPL